MVIMVTMAAMAMVSGFMTVSMVAVTVAIMTTMATVPTMTTILREKNPGKGDVSRKKRLQINLVGGFNPSEN